MTKRIFYLFLVFLVYGQGYAATQIGDLWYELNSEAKTAEVVKNQGAAYEQTEIAIPSSVTFDGEEYAVTSIGEAAFRGCYALVSITIPESVKSIGSRAFVDCNVLTSITIPESVTSIGNNAFVDCYALTSITIPKSVTSIGDVAFYGCITLTSITIPESVKSIGIGAFIGCGALASITLPEGLTSIGDQAFYGCEELATIFINAQTPPSIGSDAFNDVPATTIVVPCGALEAYKEAAGWKDLSMEFVEPFTDTLEEDDLAGGAGFAVYADNGDIVIRASEPGVTAVYGMNGQAVRASVNYAEGETRIPGLAAGAYIVAGRKVVLTK